MMNGEIDEREYQITTNPIRLIFIGDVVVYRNCSMCPGFVSPGYSIHIKRDLKRVNGRIDPKWNDSLYQLYVDSLDNVNVKYVPSREFFLNGFNLDCDGLASIFNASTVSTRCKNGFTFNFDLLQPDDGRWAILHHKTCGRWRILCWEYN